MAVVENVDDAQNSSDTISARALSPEQLAALGVSNGSGAKDLYHREALKQATAAVSPGGQDLNIAVLLEGKTKGGFTGGKAGETADILIRYLHEAVRLIPGESNDGARIILTFSGEESAHADFFAVKVSDLKGDYKTTELRNNLIRRIKSFASGSLYTLNNENLANIVSPDLEVRGEPFKAELVVAVSGTKGEISGDANMVEHGITIGEDAEPLYSPDATLVILDRTKTLNILAIAPSDAVLRTLRSEAADAARVQAIELKKQAEIDVYRGVVSDVKSKDRSESGFVRIAALIDGRRIGEKQDAYLKRQAKFLFEQIENAGKAGIPGVQFILYDVGGRFLFVGDVADDDHHRAFSWGDKENRFELQERVVTWLKKTDALQFLPDFSDMEKEGALEGLLNEKEVVESNPDIIALNIPGGSVVREALPEFEVVEKAPLWERVFIWASRAALGCVMFTVAGFVYDKSDTVRNFVDNAWNQLGVSSSVKNKKILDRSEVSAGKKVIAQKSALFVKADSVKKGVKSDVVKESNSVENSAKGDSRKNEANSELDQVEKVEPIVKKAVREGFSGTSKQLRVDGSGGFSQWMELTNSGIQVLDGLTGQLKGTFGDFSQPGHQACPAHQELVVRFRGTVDGVSNGVDLKELETLRAEAAANAWKARGAQQFVDGGALRIVIEPGDGPDEGVSKYDRKARGFNVKVKCEEVTFGVPSRG